MVRSTAVVAALALVPASAMAQNGGSFDAAATSTVRYSVASAKPT